MTIATSAPPKLIAFYLPQFHPTPENDTFWGKGFTEWFNVAKAKPLFPGHEQPRLPADMGWYDLRLKETLTEQAILAKRYGIYGFCFHYYWFSGKRVLHKPVDLLISNPDIDIPFCLNWANEPWTRRWDGQDKEILLEQEHSADDDKAFIEHLLPIFRDSRYIKINGCPVLSVYRVNRFADFSITAQLWQDIVKKSGFPGLFLSGVFNDGAKPPQALVAAKVFPLQFSPNPGAYGHFFRGHKLLSYVHYEKWTQRIRVQNIFAHWPCVFLRWDNSARRKKNAWIFYGCRPEVYGWALGNALDRAESLPEDRRFVFINAWNEWAEGSYLEPDQQYGHAFGDITRRVLMGERFPLPKDSHLPLAVRIVTFLYWFYKTFLRINLKSIKRWWREFYVTISGLLDK
jgi:hypothetical protein